MKIIVFILLIGLCSFKPIGCLQLDIIIVGDMSMSVNGKQGFVSDAIVSFIEKLDLSDDGIRIGVITFNSNVEIVSNLSSDKQDLIKRALSIKSSLVMGTTNLNDGLYSSLEMLVNQGNKDYKRLIILITDGDVDDEKGSKIISEQLKQTDTGICGILIKDGSSKPLFMKSICGDCYQESDYESLSEEINKLNICL